MTDKEIYISKLDKLESLIMDTKNDINNLEYNVMQNHLRNVEWQKTTDKIITKLAAANLGMFCLMAYLAYIILGK